MKYIKSLRIGCDVSKIVKFEISPQHPNKFLGMKGVGQINVQLYYENNSDDITLEDIEYDKFDSTLKEIENELIELFCKE